MTAYPARTFALGDKAFACTVDNAGGRSMGRHAFAALAFVALLAPAQARTLSINDKGQAYIDATEIERAAYLYLVAVKMKSGRQEILEHAVRLKSCM